jgi:hypothetical protein
MYISQREEFLNEEKLSDEEQKAEWVSLTPELKVVLQKVLIEVQQFVSDLD